MVLIGRRRYRGPPAGSSFASTQVLLAILRSERSRIEKNGNIFVSVLMDRLGSQTGFGKGNGFPVLGSLAIVPVLVVVPSLIEKVCENAPVTRKNVPPQLELEKAFFR
jgi:hypothetical protein